MRRMLFALSCMLAATFFLGIIVTGVAYWLASNPIPEEPVFDLTKLTYEDKIVGHWNRVPLDSRDNVDGFREIAATGEMATRYGDVIHKGDYKVEGTTIETTYRYFQQKSEKNRWTFGFMDGRLIMIHQKYGWVEVYERVPVSDLHPSYLR